MGHAVGRDGAVAWRRARARAVPVAEEVTNVSGATIEMGIAELALQLQRGTAASDQATMGAEGRSPSLARFTSPFGSTRPDTTTEATKL